MSCNDVLLIHAAHAYPTNFTEPRSKRSPLNTSLEKKRKTQVSQSCVVSSGEITILRNCDSAVPSTGSKTQQAFQKVCKRIVARGNLSRRSRIAIWKTHSDFADSIF